MADEEVIKTKETFSIEFYLKPEEFKEMARADPVAAAQHLDLEIQNFEDWMVNRNMDPLSRFENQILREYLAWKIVSKKS